MDTKMFCYQCQETANGTGCRLVGVCGKKPEVANAQDLLLHIIKGIGVIASRCIQHNGGTCCSNRQKVHSFVNDALFTTITNVNFDVESIYSKIEKAIALRDKMIEHVSEHGISLPEIDALTWHGRREDYAAKAKTVGVLTCEDPDVRSLKELIMYGLKGMAAYLEHASRLGMNDTDINDFILYALSELVLNDDASSLTSLTLTVGEWGVKAMALLDKANTTAYGNPEISQVSIGVGNRPGILVSGHDLNDLEQLLEQSKDSGIDIYIRMEKCFLHTTIRV